VSRFAMALVHKSKKITHCLSATKHYMRGLFKTLSQMYEEGVQTDLTLVASNGVPISVHKVIAPYLKRERALSERV